ncbi:unnamed protein product [Thelazia callipaeda]|uniref:CHCH domain-containing protein n=1 Tax=Thelazia callipaeda TaxID=103827 RepID=A0A0N5CLP2_THECL|nr:unnamed protein product [Thelazia callipaeda]
MVRRRMAAPKPSAPVHRRMPSPVGARMPPAAPMQARPPVTPNSAPNQHFGIAPPSQGPGLMGQMAATAGGVAIGSAVGHAVGNMLTGGSGNRDEVVSSEKQYQNQQMLDQQQYKHPCEFEWKQFVEW